MRYILLILSLVVGGIYMCFFKESPTSPASAKIATPVARADATPSNFLKRPLDRTQAALKQVRTNNREDSF